MGDAWNEVTYLRKAPPKAQERRTTGAVNRAMQSGGVVDTRKKYAAATNKHVTTDKNTAKLDRETEELHHDAIDRSVAQLIQKGRSNKGLTQKELATRINEKPSVVNDYESGKAIPAQGILAKMERTLGLRLRGANKGQPLEPKGKK
ncbi:hypothetical protein LOTGIDRAFT_196960 [Lottia gigantea]|uniref:HTH cro/C1-type domain-containing protein n=1 Tax=Lottia gigantea TaxID=225164 RepID=V4B5I9_LOTGI|nr:hypothetical protein LOTGIDRAFT_196960 [Lottia gigantea]ESO83744.1 hypothetical protein LOTGIDRAFT_196960 [Lottia gigantea]